MRYLGRNTWVFGLLAFIVLGGGAWLFFTYQNIEAEKQNADSAFNRITAQSDENITASGTEGKTVTQRPKLNPENQKQAAPSPTANDEAGHPFHGTEAKARVAQVANEYAQAIRFPSYSKPIASIEALQKYLPNQSTAVQRPLSADENNPLSASLHTDRFRYFVGERLAANLLIEGLAAGAAVEVKAQLRDRKTILAVADVHLEQNGYVIVVPEVPRIAGVNAADKVFRLVASMRIDGETYELGAPLNIDESVAHLDSDFGVEVDEESLAITLKVNTLNTGYFELNAILYSQSTGQPLLYLTTQGLVSDENPYLKLRAHSAALKHMQDEGPYELLDISLKRMPSAPDYTEQYAETSQARFVIDKHYFSEYAQSEYVDEQAQARLDLLRELGRTQ